ncbi:MAG: hypothetical protein QM692_12215 [Thermomicrobiales bacterium]
MARVTVLGAGDMGTAMLTPLAVGTHEVRLWATPHDAAVLEALRDGEPHPRLGVRVPSRVALFGPGEVAAALDGAEIVLLAVSSAGVRPVMTRIAPHLAQAQALVILTKGLERTAGGGAHRLSQVVAGYTKTPVVAVGGPGIAREVALGIPTVAVFGSASFDALQVCDRALSTPSYYVETTEDIAGVELSAALKNAYALAFGMIDGVEQRTGQSHANLRASLMPVALEELSKLVALSGGDSITVAGQAGLGDLQVTASAGRNRLLGERIGAGATGEAAMEELAAAGITTEGFTVLRVAHDMAIEVSLDADMVEESFPLLSALWRVAEDGYEPVASLWEAVRNFRMEL